MQTIVLDGQQALQEGAEIIKQGGVVVFPTETVYGIGANAFNPQAVKQIYIAKGRPSDNPLIAHISNKQQISLLAREISPQAQVIIDKFMPGAITIILPKSNNVDKCVTAGLDTIGIRMPSHEVAQQFIEMCGVPIVAPSANTSTHISPTSAKHVYEDMQGKIPLIIDGGECQVGIESTIIDMSGQTPTILRPGAITAQMLAQELGQVQTFKGEVVVAKAPGMKYKHYAPKCDMAITDDINIAISTYKTLLENKNIPIIICSTQWSKEFDGIKFIDVGNNDSEVARKIYSAMHSAQKISNFIICQDFGKDGIYSSVMNRLVKASGGKRL